jgi:tetratricopeptide (TPR) repeat protein
LKNLQNPHADDGGFLFKFADMTKSNPHTGIRFDSLVSNPARCLCFVLAIGSLKAGAASVRPDTLIHGFRCEPAAVFWLPQELYTGMTADIVIKKILKDGNLADYIPMQHFILQINDTSGETKFLLPNKTFSAEVFDATLPLQFKAGTTEWINIKAWAIVPDVPTSQYDHLPLSIPSPELEGKIWQTMGYIKLNLRLYEDSRAAFRRAIHADSSNCAYYFYDLGCTYARQGIPSQAFEWLHLAIDSGYSSYAHALKRDTDLESLRSLPQFRSIITAPLSRVRTKLLADFSARPERASDDYFEIARTYLKQGDIDSFYVSLESGLQRGLIPKLDDLTEEKEFGSVQRQGILDSLVRKYVSPILLAGANADLSKRRHTMVQSVLHPTTLALSPSPSAFESLILLQVGDTITGVQFYALDWTKKSVKSIGAMTSFEAKWAREIQTNSNGIIAFTQGDPAVNEQLSIRKGDSTVVVDAPFHDAYLNGSVANEHQRFPSFSLSPNGAEIIASACREVFIVDTAHGTVFTQILVSCLEPGKKEFNAPRIDTVATTGFHADASFQRVLWGWDFHDPEAALLQDLYPGQLETKVLRLWKYYPQTHAYRLASPDVQRCFSTSLNGTYVLFTNNDETCCAGINYTDNRLILLHTETGSSATIYDEWGRFGNHGKLEEHEPTKAEMSPDGRWIAATISNLYDPTSHSTGSSEDSRDLSGKVTGDVQLFVIALDGTVRLVVSNRELVGWLDATHILIQQCAQQFKQVEWNDVRSEPRVFDINTGTEHPLLTTDAECVGIQWRSSKDH